MSINLIPPQLKTQRKIRKKIEDVYFFGIILISVAAGTVISLFAFNQILKSQISSTETEIARLDKEVAKYAEIEKRINSTNQKLDKINAVDKDRVLWSVILTEIAKSTPSQVLIKNLSLFQGTKSLTMVGEAENRREIARFKEKLESSSVFKNVYFSSSSVNEERQNFTFSLNAELENIK